MTGGDRSEGRAHKASPLDDMVKALRTHGVDIPGDLPQAMRKCVRPVRLDAVSVNPAPDDLVRAWRATYKHAEKREAVWIPLLHMFREHFSRRSPALEKAVRAANPYWSLAGTRREVTLQFGSRCFHLGQKLLMNGRREPARFLLNEAVQALTWADRNGRPLPLDRRCHCHGQLAIALVLLARDLDETDPEATVLLTRAEGYSALAEQGDKTEQHFAYRMEIHLRLFRADRDPAHLEKAQTILHTLVDPPATRRLRAARADVLAGLGMARLRSGQFEEGLRLLTDAESAFTEAERTAALPDTEGAHSGYLLARRGYVRHQLYRFDTDFHGRRSTAHLQAALTDLLTPEAADHISGQVIAAALLDRSRVLSRRGDREGAATDLARARDLLGSLPPSARLAAKARAQELDAAIAVAVGSQATDELRRLAREIIRLPSDAPIPAAALSRACKSVVAAEGIDQCRLLLEDALERLEIDVIHPELSQPGRRHVASHAALIARLLARSDEEAAPAALDRALTLYRTSFDAVDDPASVDAYADAGASALALAKILARSGDADAEDAAGLLREAVDWLGKAVAKARTGSGARRHDFDPVITHSRLGEAALRSHGFTPDDRLLDVAIDNLQESLNLEVGEAAEPARPERNRTAVLGHLGDAYYRRGTRAWSSADLERAIELKEETYTDRSQARENRSVAAAAAERLHRITSDATQLTRSAGFALQASTCDAQWPWPVLQLADLARQHESLDPSRLADRAPASLSALLLAGDRPGLLERAAELAARNREFLTTVLGGQKRSGKQGVFVLDDSHRLIGQTIVLKRLSASAALQEREWTQRFRQWLTDRDAPQEWLLPEPLGLVSLQPHEQDAVYVMRRMHGRLLGATVIDHSAIGGEDPLPHFVSALRYLAAFQAWRAQDDPGTPRTANHVHADEWAEQVARYCDKLDAGRDITDALTALVGPLAEPGSPVVAKKDPHPGNWIVTRRGELVLFDIESSGTLPLLQEAVTVIDDLPLLPLDAEGWTRREELRDTYLAALHEFGLPVPDAQDIPVNRLEALTAFHAVKGIGRTRGWGDDGSSFTLSLRSLQYEHYWNILDHLAADGRDPSTRAFCRLFLGRYDRVRTVVR
ncbi:hypothetical protein [Streptomyces sp. NPDC002588]|uniref:hypothetical protein n=1 Tax=Streptomyces sp. NPDC002588 TaxID=3154419 RepID=UPI003323229D